MGTILTSTNGKTNVRVSKKRVVTIRINDDFLKICLFGAPPSNFRNYKSALTKNIHIVKKSVRQIFGKLIKCKIWPISKIAQNFVLKIFFKF